MVQIIGIATDNGDLCMYVYKDKFRQLDQLCAELTGWADCVVRYNCVLTQIFHEEDTHAFHV